MRFDIKKTAGRWTVNGKKMDQLNDQERQFMNKFFKEMKITYKTKAS